MALFARALAAAQAPVTGVDARRRLLILGTRGIPAEHGGFETFAERLAPWLGERGWDVTVYCQGRAGSRRGEDAWQGVRRVHVPTTRSGAAATVEFDIASARDACRRGGLVLMLGYNTGFLVPWLRRQGARVVVNMDGLEYARAKYGWPAKAYLWANERLAARSAHRLIADHPAIADHLATRTARARIATIAYGADEVVGADPALLDRFALTGPFFTLIARPEPENGVIETIRAFSAAPRGARLAVLGAYDVANAYHRACRAAAGPEVAFVGPVYDRATLAALRHRCLAYLHGHRVGGTNPSLVEALGAGSAVIAHDNRFNRWVAGDAALYAATQADIAAAIERVRNDAGLRERLSAAARQRWRAAFTWPDILARYEEVLTDEFDRTQGHHPRRRVGHPALPADPRRLETTDGGL